jgi:DNA polymerase-3 subunit delta'
MRPRTPKSEPRVPKAMGLESFLGNTKAVEAVRAMVAQGRVPGALLFTGPEGVGKKTLALMFAKSLNCERLAAQGDFCGECARCRKAEEMLAATREDLTRRRESKDSQRRTDGLVYFDLQLIEPITQFILTEQIRQLRAVAYTRPFEFPRRVFVIDEAQAIHWQAIDLLLKVLEEPPETTTLILVCPNAHELRPTIRSRCRLIPFQTVDDSQIADLLTREGRVPKTQRALAVRVAAGSVAKARSLDLSEFERRRRPWLVFLDAVASSREAAHAPDWKALFDSTKALAADSETFEETLRIGYSLLRDLLTTLDGGKEAQVVNVDLRSRLKAWSAKLGLRGIETLKDGLDQAYRLQVRNVNQQLGFDTLAVELLNVSTVPSARK